MLNDYTEEPFTRYMTSMFTNSNDYANGKMKSRNGDKAAGHRLAAKTGDKTTSDLQTQLDSAGLVSSGNGTSPIISFNFINMF